MKRLINLLKNFRWNASDSANYTLEDAPNSTFVLSLGNINVGYLEFQDDIWQFYYSNEFKSQNEILPLVNFPDKEQTYQVNGDNLWPFFMSRIPGESRLKKDGKDKMDLVSLLKFYGKRTIANPYTLSST